MNKLWAIPTAILSANVLVIVFGFATNTGVIGSFLGLLAASSEHSVVNIGVSIFTTFLENVASLVAFLNYAFE